MKYFKQSFGYIFKNIGNLALYALPASVFIGLLLNPFSFFDFMLKYPETEINSFGQIFTTLMDNNILLGAGAMILVIISVSILVGVIERHFKTGTFTFRFRQPLNNNAIAITENMVFLLVIHIVSGFIVSGLVFIFHMIGGSLGAVPTTISIVIETIIICITIIIEVAISLCTFINAINMIINGYRFKESMGNTFRMIGNKFFSMFIATLIPLVLSVVVSLLFSDLQRTIVETLVVFILIMYYSAFTVISYYDMNEMRRYDKVKYYNR